MSETRIRSSLARAHSPKNEDELHGMRKRAWQQHGVLNVDPEIINNWEDKQHLINIGNKLYGEREE